MSEEEVPYTSQRFADDSEVFDVVNDGIDFLLDNVETEADVRFADKLVVPLATKAAMLKLKRLTSWAVLQHDGVIDENDIEKPLEWLQADEDPKAIAVDSWARGMVPTRVVKAQAAGEQYRTLGGKIGDDNLSPRSQSASSRVSSNTGTSRSGTTRRSKSQYGGGAGSRVGTAHSKFEEEEEDPTGQIIELDDEFEAIDFGLGGLSLDQLLKKDLKNQNITEEEEVERDHFEVQQEEIDAAIKDLPKGKKYVIDRDGQVIPINATSAAKLPPYQINPSTKIHNYVPPAPAASRGGTRGGTAQSGRNTADTQGMDGASLLNEAGSTVGEGKRAKKQIKVAGARMVAEDDGLFKPSHSLRDILSTGNSIVPTSGVTLVVDGQGRAGPEVASVPGRMSEKEYRARLDKGDVSRPMNSTQQLEVEDPSLLLGAQAFGGDSVDQPPLNPDATTQMRQELQYKVPDIDPFEGGKRRGINLEHSSVEVGATDSYDEPPQEAMDTSRGKGIAHLPQPKQTGVRLYSHDTTHTGTPKDRDLPVNKKKPSELTKQRAPPPGKVSSIPPNNSPGGGWGGPDSPGGVRTGGTGTGSPTGSVASKSVNSRASGKVGQVRSKGKIINDKPHLAKQIF